MQSRKKVLLLLKTPPPYGGGEVRASWLKEHFSDREEYKILELHSSRQTRGNQGFFSVSKIYDGILFWFRFLKELIVYRPNVIFKNFAHGGLPFIRDSFYLWTAKLFKADFLCELAGEHFHFLNKSGFGKWYATKVLKSMKFVRVLGTSIQRQLKQHSIHNTIVMDNGVMVPGDRQSVSISSNDIIKFLFVGLHGPSKGFDVLIKSCLKLDKEGFDFQLHTIGEWVSWEFENHINDIIFKHSSLRDKVSIHGLQNGKSKWNIFESCHVLVLPSITEGQPLSILEAMSFGMSIISTKVGGIPDVITDGVNGCLIEPHSYKQLKVAMRQFINNPNFVNTIAHNNIDLFQSRFTKRMYLQKFENWLCDSLLESN